MDFSNDTQECNTLIEDIFLPVLDNREPSQFSESHMARSMDLSTIG